MSNALSNLRQIISSTNGQFHRLIPSIMEKVTKQKLARVGECLYRQSASKLYYFKAQIRGREFTRSLHTTERGVARREAAVLRESLAGQDFVAGKMTLAHLIERYRPTFAHQAAKTIRRKEDVLRRILADWPTGKLTPLTKIRPSDCTAWLAKYKFGAASRNGHIHVLKDLLASAVHDNALSVSPAEHLKAERRPDPVRLTPTWEQFLAIVDNVRSQRFNGHGAERSADFLLCQGLLGLGQAEIIALLRRDVDLERGVISVLRRKTTRRFTLPIFPQARVLVEKLCKDKRQDDKLFTLLDAKRALIGACHRLGLPKFSQRSLRRVFITKALELGVDVKTIASWQGHSDGGQLILKTYSHLRPQHVAVCASLMV